VRRAHPTLTLLVLALLAGCARCGAPRGGPPPERFIPASNAGTLLIPALGEAARQAATLQEALSARPGGEPLAQARAGLAQQLTFDLLDPASLAAAGLDAGRGLAVAELPTATATPGQPGTPLLVLPIGDASKLEAQLARLARERLGAADRSEQAAGSGRFTVWRRSPGEPALLSVAQAEGSMLVAVGPTGPELLRLVLALDPALSLAASPSWRRARAALGEGAPLLFFLPRDAPALADLPLGDGLAGALSGTATGVRLVVALMLGAQEPRLRPLAGPGDGSSQPSRLDPATAVAFRLSADPLAAVRLAAEQRGLPLPEPVAALANQLSSPVELGATLTPKTDLAGLVGGRALGRPLSVVRLEAVAGLKDPAAFAVACNRLMALLGAPSGRGRWTLGGGDAELAWAVQGKNVALAAGVAGGLPPLLRRLEAGGPAFLPPPGTAGALAGGLGGLVLHGDNLAAALRALPASAYGAGPDAVVGRSLVQKLVASLGEGSAVALRADLPAGALTLTLDLKLGTAPR
jgi:hypothetical protein